MSIRSSEHEQHQFSMFHQPDDGEEAGLMGWDAEHSEGERGGERQRYHLRRPDDDRHLGTSVVVSSRLTTTGSSEVSSAAPSARRTPSSAC